METKKCRKCGLIKNLDKFPISTNSYGKTCKQCHVDNSRRYTTLYQIIYSTQRAKSKKRGHPYPEYTIIEFKDWLYAQPNIKKLYDGWVKSNYNPLKKPSVDRLNDYEGYKFSNIRLVTWEENHIKGINDKINHINTKQLVKVNQYSIEGDFIRTFASIKEINDSFGAPSGSFKQICKSNTRTFKGFRWKYYKDFPNTLKLPAFKYRKGGAKLVCKYDEEGNFLKEYSSLSEASLDNTISDKTVNLCAETETYRINKNNEIIQFRFFKKSKISKVKLSRHHKRKLKVK